MATRRVVRTVDFPKESRPHMLRVSPDGKEVWVQTTAANTNVVLRAEDLTVLATEPTGMGPVASAWTPDRRYVFITNNSDTVLSVFDADTYREIKRIAVGPNAANIAFTRDGRTAYVSVRGADAVAVIDVERLEVLGYVKVGREPQGLIIL
jgi:YVTN family beta-propeller protein